MGDVLKVAVEGGLVRFYKNGVLVYTENTPDIVYPLVADTSLHSASASIADLYLCGPNLVIVTPPACQNGGATAQWINTGNASISGDVLTKLTGGNAWNAGATSVQSIISGDGFAQATITSTATRFAFGLSNSDSNQSFGDMDYAFSVWAGVTSAYVRDVKKSGDIPYAVGDKLTVAVESGKVKFYRNGNVFYTENTPNIAYPLLVDTSIHDQGSSVPAVTICGTLADILPPSCTTGTSAVQWTNTGNASISGDVLTKPTGGNAWNAGAISVQSIISGDGFAQTTITSTTTRYGFGLSNSDSNQSFGDMDYAFSVWAGVTSAYVRDVKKTNDIPYVVGDKLTVAVESGKVKFYRNGIVLYTENAPNITYPLLVDTSIHDQGSSVPAVTICGTLADILPPGCTSGSAAVQWTNTGNASISGDVLIKPTGGNTWNAGAISVQSITSGDGFVQLTITSTTTRYGFGLSNSDWDQSFGDMDYAFSVWAGVTSAYVRDVKKTGDIPYVVGDKLTVAVESGKVKFYRNGIVLYTENAPNITYPLLVDTSIHDQGSSIPAATLCGTQSNNLAPACTNGSAAGWINPGNVSVAGNTITKSAGGGAWNAGAASMQQIIAGDGYVQLTVDTTATNRGFGLSNGDSNQDFYDIDFAMALWGGHVDLYVRGTRVRADLPYVVGDKLTVAIEQNTVKFYRNGTVWYSTSNSTITYPLLVDTSIYTQGATFSNLQMCASNFSDTPTPSNTPTNTPTATNTPLPTSTPSGSDVFLNKPASGSGDVRPPAYANDGDASTSWYDRNSYHTPAWTVDLGVEVPINEIRIHQDAAAYSRQIVIQGQSDNGPPVTLATANSLTGGWSVISWNARVAYRYYKVLGTDLVQGYTGYFVLYSVQGYAGPPLPPPPADDVFRSKASSSSGGSNSIYANDGNDATSWADNNSYHTPAWQVDLGSEMPVNKIRLYQAESSYALTITVQGKSDNGPYVTLTSTTSPLGPGWIEIAWEAKVAYRYYRVYAGELNEGYTGVWHVFTVQGYVGPPVPPPPAGDLFLGKVSSASSADYGNPAHSNDGNDATAWSDRNSYHAVTWQVDVGASAVLSQVRVYQAEDAYSRSIIVQGSINNATWVDLTTVSSLSGGWINITMPGVTPYRYYKVVGNDQVQGYTGFWTVFTMQGFGVLQEPPATATATATAT
ncbi:MAG TPA: discoidin domain-containing protein, partial [Chloroflexia bacterium]